MKSRILLLSVGLAAAVAVPLASTAQVAKSGQGYLLRMKWTKGKTYAYSINTAMGSQKQPGSYSVKVKDVKNGVATLDVTTNMSAAMGGKQTQTLKMDSTGKVIDGADGAMQAPAFPAKAVKVGETWKDSRKVNAAFPVTVNNTYTFKGLKTVNKKQLAEIAISTKGASDGMSLSGTGTMYLDLAEGMLHSSKNTVNVSIKMGQEPGSQPTKITMTMSITRTK